MSSRKLKDWLNEYLDYTENTEPPKSYHTWVGLSAIAGVLQRRVWTVWGHESIRPNLYVVLVGPSGKCRKGTAMRLGRDLLVGVQLNMVSESITREALIKRFSNSVKSFTDPTDRSNKQHCSLTVMSDELSVFLGQSDIKFLADLTDWYDSHDLWTYETKGAGTDKIVGICLNLLGATAPDWLSSILPQEAIGGGFTSRIIFVTEEKKGKTIAEPTFTDKQVTQRKELIHDLEIMATLCGPFNFSAEARGLYGEWYTEQERLGDEGYRPVNDPRFAGYTDRRANHIRKLSMVMSVSRSNSLKVESVDFKRALDILISAEKNMHKTFGGLGKSLYSEATEKFLDYLIVHKTATRSEIMKQFYRDIDSGTLKVVEEIVEHMKVVKISRDLQNNEVTYEFLGFE